MKYLITGGAGFIGSHIAEELQKDLSNEVICLDNLRNGKEKNLEGLRVKFARQGITEDIESLLDGVDTVFHLAAEISVSDSFNIPRKTIETNLIGTVNLLEAMKKKGVKKIVFSSTSAVFGEAQYKPVDENHPIVCDSPYAISKYASEQFIRLYCHNFDLKSAIFRYFNVFGPRQSSDSEYGGVVAVFIDRVKKGEPLLIFGTGEQTRDFIFVKDVARANVAASKYLDSVSGRDPEYFNLGAGREVSVNEIAELIGGKDYPKKYAEKRLGESMFDLAKIERAENLLGIKIEDSAINLARWREWSIS